MFLFKYLHLWWQKHIEKVDPFNLQFKLAAKTTISCSGLFLAAIFLKLPYAQIVWLLLANLFVMMMYLGDSVKQRIMTQIIGTLISIVIVYIGSLVGAFFVLYLLLMLAGAFITFYLLKYGLPIFVPALLILILLLFSLGIPAANISGANLRVFDIFIGSAWAILVANLIWPYRPRKLLQKYSQKTFRDIAAYLRFVVNDSVRGNIQRIKRYQLKSDIIQSLAEYRKLIEIYGTEVTLNRFRRQSRIFMQIAALSDVFIKPNSEYTLDILTEFMGAFNAVEHNICVGIVKADLAEIFAQFEPLKKYITDSHYESLVVKDIKCIALLLEELHGTLADIAG